MAKKIYKPLRVQLIEERRKLEKQTAVIAQLEANQDYLAMMSDIELESDDETETESEVTE